MAAVAPTSIDPSEAVVSSLATLSRNASARFDVFVNPPAGKTGDVSHPSFAGSVSIFGGHAHGTVEFAVAITPAVRALRKANALKTSEPLRIHVLPAALEEKAAKASVINVEVGAF